VPSPDRFPSSAGGLGFKPLADYIHSLGLKFGIYYLLSHLFLSSEGDYFFIYFFIIIYILYYFISIESWRSIMLLIRPDLLASYEGIHIMRGIPRIATQRNTPIYGSRFTAKDATNTTVPCSWSVL